MRLHTPGSDAIRTFLKSRPLSGMGLEEGGGPALQEACDGQVKAERSSVRLASFAGTEPRVLPRVLSRH